LGRGAGIHYQEYQSKNRDYFFHGVHPFRQKDECLPKNVPDVSFLSASGGLPQYTAG
jgi:hypothetical protein